MVVSTERFTRQCRQRCTYVPQANRRTIYQGNLYFLPRRPIRDAIEVRLQREANLLKWESTLRYTVGDLSESFNRKLPFKDDYHDCSLSYIQKSIGDHELAIESNI